MTDEDKKVVNQLRALREKYEAEKRDILDSYMSRYYPNISDYWRGCKRSALEVESWPDWMQRSCLSGIDLNPKKP